MEAETRKAPAATARPRALAEYLRRAVVGASVPLVGTAVVVALAERPSEAGVLALLVFACSTLAVSKPPPWAALLPLMRLPLRTGRAVAGVAGLVAVQAVTGIPGLSFAEILIVLGATSLAGLIAAGRARRWAGEGPVRAVVIGSSRWAVDLAGELRGANVTDYVIVGRVAIEEDHPPREHGVPTLGTLFELGRIVEEHRVQLIVMTGEIPRFRVFDEVSRSCLQMPVRLWELSGFYEEVFGHVPVADINGAWFQYIMHPNYRAIAPAAKRVIDLVVACSALVFFLPVLGVAALLIRRDGGPVFFKQTRIGEAGRPLTVYKLRTMHTGSAAEWATGPDDPRVTPVGRLLRKMHLDEIPQLFNVIRGDMSLVGPRPEQPDIVAELEELIGFYQRRHLVKPGITGWAQVRCGYAGSNIGSAWKLSHDLYYVKHRSVLFDLALLAETIRTLFFDRQYSVEPSGVLFLLRESDEGRPSPVPQRERTSVGA